MRSTLIITILISLLAGVATAQTIVQSRGVDALIDYASLSDYGPWDDRNYLLTADDLELLGENEAELSVQVPLFYRVELRRQFGNLPTTGPGQYPRSALPQFLIKYGGFLIDGVLYHDLKQERENVVVDTSNPWMTEEEYIDFTAKSLTGDVRVTNPTGGAESAVAINPVNTDIVISGSNGPTPINGQQMQYSADGGETWNVAGALPLGNTCCDPTVAWSSDGSKAYAATIGWSFINYVYRSGDNGLTWTDLENEPGADPRREIGSNIDKEYLHVDTHAGSACLDDIYLTWHESNTLKFSRSTDMAHTWSSPMTISSGFNEKGIGSDITSDTSGTVYYFWPAMYSKRILVRTSSDCGVSFDSAIEVSSTQASYDFPVPSMSSREVFVYVSAAADLTDGAYGGSVYASWTDSTATTSASASANHARIQVAYSRDGGTTWNTSTPHETADADSVDRWHQWLAVGPDGTVHVVFYDTRNDPTRTSVDFYWSTSTDGAVTWSSPEKITSEISPSINPGFQFGDYNGMDVAMDRLIAVFTDNRNEGGGAADSVDIYAAGRTLEAGSDIFADDFESGNTNAWN